MRVPGHADEADDNARLWIQGQLVIDHWSSPPLFAELSSLRGLVEQNDDLRSLCAWSWAIFAGSVD